MSRTIVAPAPTGRRTGCQSRASATMSAGATARRTRPGLCRGGAEPAVAQAVFGLLPERHDLARVEDRRVRPGDDPDEQREREVPHRIAAEEVEREEREHDG